MATYYVRSTDGVLTDDGLTWATAEPDLHQPTWAAGDVIYVSDNHAQSTAAAITIDSNGTLASPTKIICVDDAAEPPTAVATTATVTTTGASSISINDTCYVEGITFSAGSAANAASINIGGVAAHFQKYKNCGFVFATTATSSSFNIGVAAASSWQENEFENCTFTPGRDTGQLITFYGRTKIKGGAFARATFTTPPIAYGSSGESPGIVEIDGFYFNIASSTSLITANPSANGKIILRNCKLPDSWTGNLLSATVTSMGFRAEMYNCDSSDTNYRLWIEDYAGSIKHSTAVYNDVGATDGTTRISWVMATTANAEYPVIDLASPEIVKWNETTGSAITATVEIVHNSQGSGTNGVLNDDECWLEIQYLGTSGRPLSLFANDCKVSVLATAAAQATSSASWTGDAAGWDTQKLEVTFTPQEKGFIHAVVHVAKASATVYVDPLLTVA